MTTAESVLSYTNPNEALLDLEGFMKLTQNYGTKLYSLEYSSGSEPDVKHHIWVEAIAISRMFTYRIRWKIVCEEHKELDKGYYGLEGFVRHKTPPFGYIPKDEKVAEMFFPSRSESWIDGKYLDYFSNLGFTLVGRIDD